MSHTQRFEIEEGSGLWVELIDDREWVAVILDYDKAPSVEALIDVRLWLTVNLERHHLTEARLRDMVGAWESRQDATD